MKKLIIAFIVALIMIIGCAATPRDIPGPVDPGPPRTVYSDDQSYPQMYTPEQLARMPGAEARFNVTFLGAYTDNLGAWIFWVRDNTTGKSGAIIMLPGRVPAKFSAGEGYEMYMEACKYVGNCT
jgi:hypothetical protein